MLIAAHTSWHVAFLVIAVIMAATMLTTFWAPEPLDTRAAAENLADAVWHPLKDLVSQKGAWGFLLLVLIYKAGDAFALSLYSAFMIKGVGFSLDELSIAGKANMTVSTIVGVTLGGLIYMRWGMFRSLLVLGIGQSLTNLDVLGAGVVRQEAVADGARHHAGYRRRRHGAGRVRGISHVLVQHQLQRHPVRAALRHGFHPARHDRLHRGSRWCPTLDGRNSSW